MKKTLTAIAATALMSLAGFAGAAEPMQLTDNQMDTVSAGQSSIALSFGEVRRGTVASAAETLTFSRGNTRVTAASAAVIASGVDVRAAAAAGSRF